MSFDILNRSLDLSKSYFLEASAGTGKTFAIEQLIVRLLLEREEAIHLRQILAVTFTRDAVRDMKMRVRENLERIAHNLREKKNDLGFDYLTALIDKEEPLRRVEEALLCFDEVQIFTIHAFCEKMLCEFAFEAEHTFSNEVQNSRSLMKRAAKDFFRTTLTPTSYGKRQIEKLLRKHSFDINRMTSSFLDGAQKTEKRPTFEEALKEFNRHLGLFSGQDFLEEFHRVAPAYKGVSGEETRLQVEKLAFLIAKGQCSADEFDELLKEKEWFLEKLSPDNLKKKAAEVSSSLFEAARRVLLPLLQTASDGESTFARMTAEYQQFWAEQEERLNVFTPDGILEKMERAIQDPAFCEKLRARYCTVIVDEFQDTDALQWKILNHLFGHTQLFIVGDPKQSIYGFRKADLNTYFKASKTIAGGDRHFLDKNFRSHHTLVSALNALFSVPNWLGSEKLLYRAVLPKESSSPYDIDDGKGPVHFFVAEAALGRGRKWPSKEIEEDYFFPFIATEIHELQIPFAAIAILVNDRYQAQRLQSYLQSCGLSATVKRTSNLCATPAFLAMKQLLEAVLTPKNSRALFSFLAGPLIGWNHDQIKAANDVTEFQEKLFSLRAILEKSGFGPFFAAFAEWKSADADLRQIASILIEEARPMRELLLYLQELEKKDLEEEPRLKRQESEEAHSVQIMTMHASKGLEFEIVFALGLASRKSSEEEDEEKIAASDVEKMRLLYVALTRAKTRVYVPLAVDLDGKEPTAGRAAPIELFYPHIKSKQFEGVSYGHLEKRSCPSFEIKEGVIESTSSKLKLPHFPSKTLLSFSKLAAVHIVKREERTLPSEKTIHTLPMGSETGTLLHRILEKSVETGLYTFRDPIAWKELVLRELKRTPLEEWGEIIVPFTEEILRLPLADFCLADIPPENLMQEMEFLFSPNDQLIKGFIDLAFLMRGKVYILDWKSNWLGATDADYSKEKIEQTMQDNDYFLQASIYASAVQQYVKLFDIDASFGGALYVFLRGKAVYSFIPQPLEMPC